MRSGQETHSGKNSVAVQRLPLSVDRKEQSGVGDSERCLKEILTAEGKEQKLLWQVLLWVGEQGETIRGFRGHGASTRRSRGLDELVRGSSPRSWREQTRLVRSLD